VILAAQGEPHVALGEWFVRRLALSSIRRRNLEKAVFKSALWMLPRVRDSSRDERLDANAKLANSDTFATTAAGASTGLGVFQLGDRHGPLRCEVTKRRLARLMTSWPK
jgi:hypothetical protein